MGGGGIYLMSFTLLAKTPNALVDVKGGLRFEKNPVAPAVRRRSVDGRGGIYLMALTLFVESSNAMVHAESGGML